MKIIIRKHNLKVTDEVINNTNFYVLYKNTNKKLPKFSVSSVKLLKSVGYIAKWIVVVL